MANIFFQTDEFRFSYLSTLLAIVFGFYFYTISFGLEHYYFFLSAPIATFFSCYFVWKWTFKTKEARTVGNVIFVGLFLTVLTHFLNFIILNIGEIAWEALRGRMTWDDVPIYGEFGVVVFTSWIQLLISLYYFGLITFLCFTAIGIVIIRKPNQKLTRKDL